VRTKVQRWGNSLAVRIPRAFAREAQLGESTPVELTLVDGKIVLAAMPDPGPTLDELLAGVTEQNLHGELDTGSAVGNETW
jgi:antitoxin MazE